MSFQNRTATGLVLLFAQAVSGMAFGDTISEEEPQSLVTKSPEPTDEDDEAVGLDAVLTPLRLLFGGVLEAIGMGDEANPADPDQIEALTVQTLQQMRPMLVTELEFVRLVCGDIPAEQRILIKEAGRAALKEAAKILVKQQLQAENGQAIQLIGVVINNDQPTEIEPGKMIRKAISSSLKQILNDEQLDRYTAELRNRMADRKRASILNVISRLDDQLFLSVEQRDKIDKSIGSHWKEDWENWLGINDFGDQYFPSVPDECLVPHLNPEQRVIWNGLAKVEPSSWDGDGGHILNADGWWGPNDAEDEQMEAEGRQIFMGGRAMMMEMEADLIETEAPDDEQKVPDPTEGNP